MMQGIALIALLSLALLCGRGAALNTAGFESQEWTFESKDSEVIEQEMKVKFVVALELHDKDVMHDTLMQVSDPAHAKYGSYWTAEQLSARFGPTAEERETVLAFFRGIGGAEIQGGQEDFVGDMFEVTASVTSINAAMQTELAWVSHRTRSTEKRAMRAVRAVTPLTLPPHLHPLVSFLSLNSPVSHVLAQPRAPKAPDVFARKERRY
jgi:subtilase family serine protease